MHVLIPFINGVLGFSKQPIPPCNTVVAVEAAALLFSTAVLLSDRRSVELPTRVRGTIGTAEYDGETAEGRPHGSGVMTYASGSTYDGQWRCGKRHGRGTMKFPTTAATYDGEWVDGVPHGFGVLVDGRGECHPCWCDAGTPVLQPTLTEGLTNAHG